MNIQNELVKEKNLEMNDQIETKQKNFLDSTFGKIINNATDIGIRYLLPDIIEDEVIEIKDALFQSGFKEAINTAVDRAIDMGKSAIGIITGKFDNVTQIQTAVENGGIIDSVSNVLDNVVNKAKDKGLIDKPVANIIKTGKNTILDNVSKNIKDTLTQQVKDVEKLESYAESWKKFYREQNFNGMEKEYKKIEEKLTNLIPLEKTINMSREIQTIHNLIKNNGHNFNLSYDDLALVEKFNELDKNSI